MVLCLEGAKTLIRETKTWTNENITSKPGSADTDTRTRASSGQLQDPEKRAGMAPQGTWDSSWVLVRPELILAGAWWRSQPWGMQSEM